MTHHSSSPRRPPGRRAWLPSVLAGGIVLAAACSSEQGVQVPSPPTLQAAATQVGGAVSTVAAVAPTVATSAAQLGGTAISGAAPVATGAAKAAGTTAEVASPLVTRVATAVSEARATADASTPMDQAGRAAGTPNSSPSPSPSPAAFGAPGAMRSAAGGALYAGAPVGGSATGGAGGGVAGSPASSVAPVRFGGVGLVAGHPVLTLEDAMAAPLDLAGWQLVIDGDTLGLPPSARIETGGALRLHLADGRSRGSDLYLGRESADLVRGLQPGERMILVDALGRKVAEAIVPALWSAYRRESSVRAMDARTRPSD